MNGYLNYQLENANNPFACFIQICENIACQYEGNIAPQSWFIDGFLKAPVAAEVMIEETLNDIVSINDDEFLKNQSHQIDCLSSFIKIRIYEVKL